MVNTQKDRGGGGGDILISFIWRYILIAIKSPFILNYNLNIPCLITNKLFDLRSPSHVSTHTCSHVAKTVGSSQTVLIYLCTIIMAMGDVFLPSRLSTSLLFHAHFCMLHHRVMRDH